MFDYDYRTSVIRILPVKYGTVMDNVELPKQWSQIATDILAQKYFRKAAFRKEGGNHRPRKQQLNRWLIAWRIAGVYGANATATSLRPMIAQIFYDELIYSSTRACVPNSPWFNTGPS